MNKNRFSTSLYYPDFLLIFGLSACSFLFIALWMSQENCPNKTTHLYTIAYGFAGAIVLGAIQLGTTALKKWAPSTRELIYHVIRYFFSFILSWYAFGLLFRNLFPITLLGQASPLVELSAPSILWHFMVISPAYQTFLGATLLLCSIGLAFYKWNIPAIGLLIIILLNIAVLSYQFDHCVKYQAYILLFAGLYLSAYQWPRWKSFIQTTENAPAHPPAYQLNYPWSFWLALAFLLISWICFSWFHNQQYELRQEARKNPVYGVWDTQYILPVYGDSALEVLPKLERLFFDRQERGAMYADDQTYYFRYQLHHDSLQMRGVGNYSDLTFEGEYIPLDPQRMRIDGLWDGDSVVIDLYLKEEFLR